MADKNKFLKVKKLLNSNEYLNFINNYSNTNERLYNSKTKEAIEKLDLDPDLEFDKCYIFYDSLKEQFSYNSISRLEIVNFKTFNSEDSKNICEWLNDKLNNLTIDDIILNNI